MTNKIRKKDIKMIKEWLMDGKSFNVTGWILSLCDEIYRLRGWK